MRVLAFLAFLAFFKTFLVIYDIIKFLDILVVVTLDNVQVKNERPLVYMLTNRLFSSSFTMANESIITFPYIFQFHVPNLRNGYLRRDSISSNDYTSLYILVFYIFQTNKQSTMKRRHCVITREGSGGRIVHEEGREAIRLWRDSRRRGKSKKSSWFGFWVYSFNKDTIRHFILNFNFMVFIQVIVNYFASVFRS